MCRQKIFSVWRFSQSCPTPSGLNSLLCPYGQNLEEQQQVLCSKRRPFARPQETANSCETFCCPGCHRSDMSWVQAWYTVVLQMLGQSRQRNKIYLASWLHATGVTNYWTGQLISHRLIIIDTQVHTALDCCKNFRNLLAPLSKISKIFVATINKLFVSNFVKFVAK